jgi:hypothetical protein
MAPPIQWSDETVTVGAKTFHAATHVPSFVYPSCFSDYDVLVSTGNLPLRAMSRSVLTGL